MRIEIIALGKTKEKYLRLGVEDYLHRLKRHCQCRYRELKEKQNLPPGPRKTVEESRRQFETCANGAYKVALDPQGEQLSSEGFAERISQWEMQGKKVVSFLIGGPEGFSDEARKEADCLISLSAMTLTHEMVRLVLLEQLFRAYNIKLGTAYHK